MTTAAKTPMTPPEGGLVNFWGEIFPVYAGLRPAALVETPPGQLKRHIQYLDKNGVRHASQTQAQLSARRNANAARASSDRAAHCDMLYISMDESLALQLLETDALDRSDLMGKLLGYPECCVEHFQRKKKDPSLKNNAKQHFKYISHEPCSEHCAESIAMEERIIEEINKYNRRADEAR